MTEGRHHTRIEKLLLEAARMFNSTLEYEELIRLVLKLVTTAVNSEAALVFRVDHDRTDMKIRYINYHKDDNMIVFHRELGQGVVGWVATYKKPVIINDVHNDPRVDWEMWENVNDEIKSLISVPLIGKGQMIGVIEAINKKEGEFTEEDMDVLIGLTNQIAVAIDNANLYRKTKREALEKNLLYEIGKKLSSSLSLDEVLKEIIHSLKQVIDFTAGGVFIINQDKQDIESLYTIGYESCTEADINLKVGQGLVGYVVKTGQPIIVPDVSLNEHYYHLKENTKSEMVVPIELDGHIIGAFNVESDKPKAYGNNDLSLMTTFASQAAISIERARLHEQLVNSQKITQQLKIAREIQKSFLPKKDLSLPGYDITGTNIPSGQVGGDYYDFINIVEHQNGIAIGDVSGKGIPASLLMASFRASLIAEIRNNYSIRTICKKVNSLLYESMQPGNFVTAIYGVLDSKNHILTFCNCGHNLPVLLRKDDSVEFLKEGGLVLGVVPDATYEERPIYISQDDILFFYTDGVVEVFNEKGEEFGTERLITILKKNRHKTSQEIQKEIYQTVTAFASPEHNFDDLTMITLKRNK
ncbi:MAG: SpoIIE family protein phosphatase [FCB group bacterium]|nr:SpoIIE family protein phosphatase [FCB group bacterium]